MTGRTPLPQTVPAAFRGLYDRLAEVWAFHTPERRAQAATVGVYAGLETRTDPATYRWDGLRRSGSRRVPFILFQYTLGGQGIYRDAGGVHPLPPGRAFLAVIPSDHTYYLPAGHEWTFFWTITHHPYAVQRLSAAVGGVGKVLSAAPNAPLVLAAAELAEGTFQGGFPDRFDREGAIFRFMLELERHVHERSVSVTERDQLLSDTRRYVLENLTRRVSVDELARRHGMSRTHFSHHFRRTTGHAPADYVAEVRLAEVARQLTTTDRSLKELAGACGFADANHLCKAFRRRYHLSPGTYRRQSG
ncbi:MAG: helix-turn-helix domain-containing protein [Tepidisphaerales bacterium]